MAVVGVALTSGHPAAAASMTTASITPSSGVVFVAVAYASTTPPDVSSISGLGGTWQQCGASINSANGTNKLCLWYGYNCSGSGTLVITATATPVTGNAYEVFEFTGIQTGVGAIRTANYKSAAGAATGTSLSVTPSALNSANNAFVAVVTHRTAENVTPAQGTEIHDDNLSSQYGQEVSYLVNWTTGGMGGSWATTSGAQARAVGVEVVAATVTTVVANAASGRAGGHGTASTAPPVTGTGVGRARARSSASQPTSFLAITAINCFKGADDNASGTATAFTTGSYAFLNNKLYLLAIATRAAGTIPVASVTGGGMTWVQVDESAANVDVSIWRGYAASGASTGALTINTTGSPTAVKWVLDELSNTAADGTGVAVVQSATGGVATGTGSIALAAFADAVNNAVYAAFAHAAVESSTVDASGGYTMLGDESTTTTPNVSLATEFRIGEDTTVTMTWVTTTNRWGGVVLEIKLLSAVVVVTADPVSGRSNAVSKASALVVAATPGAGWSHGRATGSPSVITAANAASGRGRGRAAATSLVVEATPGAGWSHGRAQATQAVIAVANTASGRGRGTATALAQQIPVVGGNGRSHGYGTASGVPIITVAPASGRSKGRGTAAASAIQTAPAYGWSRGRGSSPQPTSFVPSVTVTGTGNGWSHGRASGVGQQIPTGIASARSHGFASAVGTPIVGFASGAGRGRGRATSTGTDIAVASGTGRGKGTATSAGTRIVSASSASGMARGRGVASAIAVAASPAVGQSRGRAAASALSLPQASAAGWSRGRGTVPPGSVTATGTAQAWSHGRAASSVAATTTTAATATGRARGRALAQWIPPGVVAAAPSTGYARGRGPATASVVPTQTANAASGRSRARASATGISVTTNAGSGWSHGRQSSVGVLVLAASGTGRSKGRATATIAIFTITASAQGRSRGTAQAAWAQLGVVTASGRGYAHTRAVSGSVAVTTVPGVGRARSRSLSNASVTALALGCGRSHGRGSASAAVFAPPPVTGTALGHARTWHRAGSSIHVPGGTEGHGWVHSWDKSRIVQGVQDSGRKVLVLVG
jgi:hypothetical protein